MRKFSHILTLRSKFHVFFSKGVDDVMIPFFDLLPLSLTESKAKTRWIETAFPGLLGLSKNLRH